VKRRLTLEGRTRSTAEESGRYDTGLYMPKTDEFRDGAPKMITFFRGPFSVA